MSEPAVRILAVDDPAVQGYTKEQNQVLKGFPETVQFDVVPWEQYYDTLMDTLNGNKSYDIVMAAGHLWKQDFVEKGYLAPVSLEKDDMFPAIFAEMCVGETPYLSPSFCDGHMIVYRKSILKNVLGRLPDLVITPEEYKIIAKQLNRQGYQIVMKAHVSEIFTDALPFLRMYGGNVYDEQKQIRCDEKACIEGLKQYCEMKQYACANTEQCGNAEVADMLKTKKAAMGITWSGQMGVVYDRFCIDKEDLGFATLNTAWNVTWSFAIPASCKRKEKADEVLSYLRSKGMDQIAGRVSGAPVRQSTYVRGETEFPWYDCQQQMISHAEALPDLSCAGEKNAALYEKIAEAFAGNVTPQTAMEEAAKIIRTIK